MRILFPALMLLASGPPAGSFTLEVGGEPRGEFARLHTADAGRATLVLEDGRMEAGLLALWWPELPAAALEPGRHERDAGECEGRPVTVVETLGRGLRRRERSWTLVDACPVAWDIRAAGDEGTVVVELLSFSGSAIAVSR
jgi:hypothetical protein